MEIAVSGLASGPQIEELETCPDNFKSIDLTGGVPRKSELKSRRFAVGARNFHFFEGPNFRQIGRARDLPGKFQIERFDGRGPSEIKIEISKFQLGARNFHFSRGRIFAKVEISKFQLGARNSRFLRIPFSNFAFSAILGGSPPKPTA